MPKLEKYNEDPWEYCNTAARDEDKDKCEKAKDEIDKLLIFVRCKIPFPLVRQIIYTEYRQVYSLLLFPDLLLNRTSGYRLIQPT